MNCQDAREHFSALLDAHIGLTERVPLEAHLRECEACQQDLEALRVSERPHLPVWRPRLKLDGVAKVLESIPGADLVERLAEKVELEIRSPRGRARARALTQAKTFELLLAGLTLAQMGFQRDPLREPDV